MICKTFIEDMYNDDIWIIIIGTVKYVIML